MSAFDKLKAAIDEYVRVRGTYPDHAEVSLEFYRDLTAGLPQFGVVSTMLGVRLSMYGVDGRIYMTLGGLNAMSYVMPVPSPPLTTRAALAAVVPSFHAPADNWTYTYAPIPGWSDKTCECGASKVGSSRHSKWCPIV